MDHWLLECPAKTLIRLCRFNIVGIVMSPAFKYTRGRVVVVVLFLFFLFFCCCFVCLFVCFCLFLFVCFFFVCFCLFVFVCFFCFLRFMTNAFEKIYATVLLYLVHIRSISSRLLIL